MMTKSLLERESLNVTVDFMDPLDEDIPNGMPVTLFTFMAPYQRSQVAGPPTTTVPLHL